MMQVNMSCLQVHIATFLYNLVSEEKKNNSVHEVLLMRSFYINVAFLPQILVPYTITHKYFLHKFKRVGNEFLQWKHFILIMT